MVVFKLVLGVKGHSGLIVRVNLEMRPVMLTLDKIWMERDLERADLDNWLPWTRRCYIGQSRIVKP